MCEIVSLYRIFFFVLCYVKGNRFTQFMETPRKEEFGGNVA